jgi:hypothetical protein
VKALLPYPMSCLSDKQVGADGETMKEFEACDCVRGTE